MLTKAQIEATQRWADYHLDYYVHDAMDRAHNMGELARDLAAAYSRVVALRSELVDFMASSYARPMLPIEDVLRKLDAALEG